jgi:hypothetical protein
MDWDKDKGFSVSVTSYLKVDLWLFIASHESKKHLEMKRDCWPPLSNPQAEEDTSPLWNPFDAEKV